MRREVLLVPGWSDRPRSFRHIRSFLVNAGFLPANIHTIDFRSRNGSNVEHAEELAQRIAEIPSNGARDVDIIAHSMGGLAVRYLLAHHPAAAHRIRRAISLGSPHRGTMMAWLGWGHGAHEMRPQSPFLRDLANASFNGAELISIRAIPIDLRILPGSNSVLEGARNYDILCLGHRDLLRRKRVLRRIVDLLREA
jgi:pimeloyl-ACP methyl ester carboxylesterase